MEKERDKAEAEVKAEANMAEQIIQVPRPYSNGTMAIHDGNGQCNTR